MEVVVPDLGDFSDVEIIDVLVKPGDRVEPEDPLVTLETEKAAMEVPSPAAGIVKEIKVSTGDRVSSGDLVLLLDREDAEETPSQETAERPEAQPAQADRDSDQDPRPADDRTVRQLRPSAPERGPEPVTVPELGDFAEVEVVEVLVAAGDEVEKEQGLVALETEKATMDVPAPVAGRIADVKVKAGDRVSAGDEVVSLVAREAPEAESEPEKPGNGAAPGEAESARTEAPQPDAGKPPAQPRAPAAPVAIDERSFSKAHASPSVRKLARELGVDLGRVRGSGRKGRVTAADVKSYVKEALGGGAGAALPSVPDVDFAKYGEIEIQPLSRIQKIAAPRLHASWVNVPHVTQHDEADITEMEETRQSLKKQAEERSIRLTPLAFILRACVLALAEFPRLTSSLSADGRSLVLKRYVHVGFAADTPNGLVVPVIRDADKKDIYELATALATLSEQARAGKLAAQDMQGGVFTVSSLGGIGGTAFTPIINAPEVAILGVSRSQWRPVYHEGGFVPRLMLPLSLSYDHRVIDGAQGVRFTTRLAELLGDVNRLVEAIP